MSESWTRRQFVTTLAADIYRDVVNEINTDAASQALMAVRPESFLRDAFDAVAHGAVYQAQSLANVLEKTGEAEWLNPQPKGNGPHEQQLDFNSQEGAPRWNLVP